MASAVDCGDEEMQILEAPESNVTLNDAERMELIAVITLSLSLSLPFSPLDHSPLHQLKEAN